MISLVEIMDGAIRWEEYRNNPTFFNFVLVIPPFILVPFEILILCALLSSYLSNWNLVIAILAELLSLAIICYWIACIVEVAKKKARDAP